MVKSQMPGNKSHGDKSDGNKSHGDKSDSNKSHDNQSDCAYIYIYLQLINCFKIKCFKILMCTETMSC